MSLIQPVVKPAVNAAAAESRVAGIGWRLMLRVSAGLLGGYAFTWGFTVFWIAGSVALGVDYHEAETAAFLLAFLVMLCAFLWAISARRVGLVWLVLAGGGGWMTGLAWMLQRHLLA